MHDLSSIQRDLLYVIAAANEPTGPNINDRLSEYYQKEVSAGNFYPTLDSLVNKGLIDKHSDDGCTNRYTLTDDGRDTLQTRRHWENTSNTTISASHDPEDASFLV